MNQSGGIPALSRRQVLTLLTCDLVASLAALIFILVVVATASVELALWAALPAGIASMISFPIRARLRKTKVDTSPNALAAAAGWNQTAWNWSLWTYRIAFIALAAVMFLKYWGAG